MVWKDRAGKTKVHSLHASFWAPTRPASRLADWCACPTALAARTVDIIIGRGGKWNDLLGVGNPASHPNIKRFLIAIREEQAQAGVTPKHAMPFHFNRLSQLCTFQRGRVFVDKVTPTQRGRTGPGFFSA